MTLFGLIPSLSIPEKVKDDHPFAVFSEEKCITLYNMGIEQSKFISNGNHLGLSPARYGYFRDGDFYLMGKKILPKESEQLSYFVEKEKMKEVEHTNYVPYIDKGAPLLSDGSVDLDKNHHLRSYSSGKKLLYSWR